MLPSCELISSLVQLPGLPWSPWKEMVFLKGDGKHFPPAVLTWIIVISVLG